MTELVNVRKAFSYQLESSSISYIRNYNFSVSENTVTDIPCLLNNSEDSYGLIVSMSASVPWIRVIAPNGNDITYPAGALYLQPTSSTTVIVRVDLPREIEDQPESVVTPQLFFGVASGGLQGGAAFADSLQANVDVVRLQAGEISERIIATEYDENGLPVSVQNVTWRSNIPNFAEVIDQEPLFINGEFVGEYGDAIGKTNERYILARTAGSTQIVIESRNDPTKRLQLPVTVTARTAVPREGTQGTGPTGPTGPIGPTGPQGPARVPNPQGPNNPQEIPGGTTVNSIRLTPAAPQVRVGQTTQLTAVLRNSLDNILPSEGITWRSGDRNVARVSDTGLVTGLLTGTSTISATKDGITATSLVVVIPA
jgi:hypothetical protein